MSYLNARSNQDFGERNLRKKLWRARVNNWRSLQAGPNLLFRARDFQSTRHNAPSGPNHIPSGKQFGRSDLGWHMEILEVYAAALPWKAHDPDFFHGETEDGCEPGHYAAEDFVNHGADTT